jgi:serine/threonine-protein kinase
MASVGVDEYVPAADDASLRELGRYRLLALIGRGGMGDIYLAMSHGDLGFKKLVVVKCLRDGAEENEPMRRMFIDEGELAARLTHPHVVQTYEVGDAGGLQYMAMEYLDGQPLSKIRRSVQALDQRLSAKIIADGLAGLHYAHELRDFNGTSLGIVHRDLSPPNIFVTYDGVVKLVDFGIAKTTLASRAMTEVGVLKGKIGYMAPEHVARNMVDRRADVFAMGVVLWELLAHRRLVTDKSPVAALKFLLHGEFAPPSSVRPEVDPELDRIALRALQKRAEDRYATALEMRSELEAFLERTGGTVRNEELGRLMNERFGERRQKRGQEIREWIASAEAGSLPAEAAPEQIGSTLDSDPRAQSNAGPSASSSISRKIPLQHSGSLGPHATTEALAPVPPKAWGRGLAIAAAVLVPCVAWGVFIYGATQNAEPQIPSAAAVAPLPTALPAVPARVEPAPPAPPAPVIEAKEPPPVPAALVPAEPSPSTTPVRELRPRPAPARPRPAPPATGSAPVVDGVELEAPAPRAATPTSTTTPVAAPPDMVPAAALGSAVGAPSEVKKRAPSGDDPRPADLPE